VIHPKDLSIPNVWIRNVFPVSLLKISLRKKLNLQNATIAIYTGVVSYKGLPLLLKVWNEIRRKHKNVLLILAGMGGLDIHNCEDELRTYVKVNGLENYTLFTGALQNVHEHLQASDTFVFPTEKTFPSSIIGMADCPWSHRSAPSDIVANRNRLLVQPGI
jgi:glycosyltransferase involved in cell wall biosynthesis